MESMRSGQPKWLDTALWQHVLEKILCSSIKEESRYRAGKVQLHCEVDGAALSLVTVFTLIKHVLDAGYAVWKVGDEGATPVPTDCILEPVVYTKWEDDVICTLLPMEYR